MRKILLAMVALAVFTAPALAAKKRKAKAPPLTYSFTQNVINGGNEACAAGAQAGRGLGGFGAGIGCIVATPFGGLGGMFRPAGRL